MAGTLLAAQAGDAVSTTTLQYFESAQVAGLADEDFTVRAATGRALGHLRGLIVDSLDHHLRYLVVHTVGWFSQTTLVPAASPRIDVDHRAIQIDVEDNELQLLQDLTLERALDSGVCVRARPDAT